jgi:glucose-6-phosphate isomerase
MDLLRLDLGPNLLDFRLNDGTNLGAALTLLTAESADFHARLLSNSANWPIGWLDLPGLHANLGASRELARRTSAEFQTLIVCGIGGSALGTQAVQATLRHQARDSSSRRLIVLDNVDPSQVHSVTQHLDWSTTALNVISKSGTTLETMAGFMHLLEQLEAAGPPRSSPLRTLTTACCASGPSALAGPHYPCLTTLAGASRCSRLLGCSRWPSSGST